MLFDKAYCHGTRQRKVSQLPRNAQQNSSLPMHFVFPFYSLIFSNLFCLVFVYLEMEKEKEAAGKYSPYSWNWEKLHVFQAVHYLPAPQTFSWEPNLWPPLQGMRVQNHENWETQRKLRSLWSGPNSLAWKKHGRPNAGCLLFIRSLRKHLDPQQAKATIQLWD